MYSSHYDGKAFSNPVQTEVTPERSFLKILKGFMNKPKDHQPLRPPGPFKTDLSLFQQAPEDLRITWLGHSSTLIEMDGKRILTDPVWYQRASPFTKIGPKRFFNVPIDLQDLPSIDFILLSHDHYDHMDRSALVYLTSKEIPVITMLKVGNHLKKWGVNTDLVSEMDWWEEKQVKGFTITALPARHFSGRWINDRFHTLWGSFAIRGKKRNVYFGADSGYYEGFEKIGEKLGPFDMTMLDTGAYHELWQSIHMGPENAVKAHLDLKGKLLMPIHWGTFSLAFHPWTEPAERMIKAAAQNQVDLFLPVPGQPTPATRSLISEWWRI